MSRNSRQRRLEKRGIKPAPMQYTPLERDAARTGITIEVKDVMVSRRPRKFQRAWRFEDGGGILVEWFPTAGGRYWCPRSGLRGTAASDREALAAAKAEQAGPRREG